ncbi:alginate lyase family protein [Collimonas sp.]|jgi:poly(beta-D-mannuronate) lyase|uniref:alginate lyase family protein n=1 Tax=Collimonas sp. TaxID=1963772 RepID=UPI002CBCF6E6|nr:alginate lyase family protein [Collimonas sp.]HWW05738.1 alginate lyase family protein [Collimonas sp.]
MQRHLSKLFLTLCACSGSALAACPPAPAGLRDIDANGYYTDTHYSVIDPVLKAKEEAAVKPFSDYLSAVSANADRYIASGDTAAAQCALSWLDRWAVDGAMLGKVVTSQAQYERKWTLAGVALAYLKLRPQAEPAQREHIEAWLPQLADAALAFADNGHQPRNNHYYWVGLAVMATGMATGEQKYINAASRIYDAALNDISDDGTLPLELNRAGRALSYHNYALAPLVMMAQLAYLNHDNWYQRRNARLEKLAHRVLSGIADPSWFAEKTGAQQEIPKGSILGWIAFYRKADPALVPLSEPLMAQAPFRNPQLGGNLSLLADKSFFAPH